MWNTCRACTFCTKLRHNKKDLPTATATAFIYLYIYCTRTDCTHTIKKIVERTRTLCIYVYASLRTNNIKKNRRAFKYTILCACWDVDYIYINIHHVRVIAERIEYISLLRAMRRARKMLCENLWKYALSKWFSCTFFMRSVAYFSRSVTR